MTDEKEPSREGRIRKEIRLRRGLTQAAVADEICVADLAIRRWEKTTHLAMLTCIASVDGLCNTEKCY